MKNKNTVTLIFSRNRSMQCDLLLRTLFFCCEDILKLSDINILYLAEGDHKESYEVLKRDYPQVNFVEEKSFKEDLLSFLPNKTSILFLCDDSVATEKFSLEKVLEDLNSSEDNIGFSLRLGKNTTKCFPYGDAIQNIPEMTLVRDNVYTYQWRPAELDYGYPFEISSSCYLMESVLSMLKDMDYSSPNTLEAAMVTNTDYFAIDKSLLLCFDKSVMFSVPSNRVQVYNQNRAGDVNVDELLRLFMSGQRMDSSIFYHYENHSAHELVDVPLVEKNDEQKQ
jgi:hypothetical protein